MKTAITVTNLQVRYDTARKRSLLNLITKGGDKVRQIEALKGVSFEIPQGDIVGIIGSNGSGKSTLLRTLAGLIAPNSGSVDLHGNAVSLLALGTGFLSELSGHDNIILSGLAMGFSKKEIMEKYDDIVAFSELGEAIERPVKTYSSGMHSKLGFSIAATLRTDILLVDEVLSVGDAHFKEKSRQAMMEIIHDKKRTVVIVSHNLAEIKKLCGRVIWLEKGHIKDVGPTDVVLDKYHLHLAKDPGNLTFLDSPTVEVHSGPEKIRLEWKAVENAEDYRVYRRENLPGARWNCIADGHEELFFEDVPPSHEISYQYTLRARATNKVGNVWSDFKPGVKGQLLGQ